MELHCLQPSRLSSIPRTGLLLLDKPILRGPTILKCGKRTFQDRTRLKSLGCRAQASGVTSTKQVVQDATTSSGSPKDGSLVFVAGATGRVGSRTVRELLKLGFRVRAGVRSIHRAESLVQSVEKMKIEDVEGGTKATNKLELVECDLENWNQIGPALGNSSVVICCIGASEKEVFDVTGPYRIDYVATKNLIEAATSAKVDYFILLTSLGTNKFGFPAAILNLFWGVLCWKRRAEEALLASGLPYTIVRPGGMERPTDSYKETHNIALSEADTLFGGQVSNLQVAELMAFMAKNRSLSYCKVVEVIAETTAPLTSMGELLQNIPSQREEIVPSKKSGIADKPQPVVPDSTYTEKEPEKIKAPASRPQSPYTAYEDLKPPTSPTPTPSTGSGATKAGKIEITPVEVNSPETSTISIDNVVPETAPKKTTPLSPYMNYEDLRPLTSPTPTTSTGSGTTEASKIEIIPAELNSSETSTISIDNVVPQTAPKKETPLSPYTSYEDLKPPTSSTPTPSTSAVSTKGYDIDIKPTEESSASSVETSSSEKSSVVIEDATPPISPKRKNALSPYINYEDLKPPSSPTPNSPSTIRAEATKAIASDIDPLTASSTSSPVEVNSSEELSVVIQNATPQCAPKRTYALSPYTAYEDLKPPSSPTPTPSGSQEKPSIVTDSTTAIPQFTGENDVASAPNGKPETPVDDKPGHVEHQVQPKARPLSPYTMYEDLKPPTSPTPSSP